MEHAHHVLCRLGRPHAWHSCGTSGVVCMWYLLQNGIYLHLVVDRGRMCGHLMYGSSCCRSTARGWCVQKKACSHVQGLVMIRLVHVCDSVWLCCAVPGMFAMLLACSGCLVGLAVPMLGSAVLCPGCLGLAHNVSAACNRHQGRL